jgi:hypothetical protein
MSNEEKENTRNELNDYIEKYNKKIEEQKDEMVLINSYKLDAL